jgi:hypothetical protein
VSKQLSISAAISVFATAAFVLLATPDMHRAGVSGPARGFAASAFQVSLPTQ